MIPSENEYAEIMNYRKAQEKLWTDFLVRFERQK